MLPLVALGVVAPLVTFAVIAREAIAGEAFGWDVTVLRHLYTSFTPGPAGDGARENGVVPDELLLVGRLGDAEILVGIVALVVAFLVVRRAPRKAAFFAAATAVAAFGPLLKEGFQRPSPLGAPDDHVFPSGHALGSMAVAAALVALLGTTRWRWPACLLAVSAVAGIGVAAVADGGHWPSDVVGGWALALAWVSIVWLLLGRGAVRVADGAEPGPSGASRPSGSLPERRENGSASRETSSDCRTFGRAPGVGAVKTAPASHSLLGWLPAVMPANAGRVRVTDPEIVACFEGTRAELVESGSHVEIVSPSAVSGEAQYAIVPLTVSAASGRSRVLSLLRRGASSIAVGLRAASVRWKLRGRNYSTVEVLRWDLGHTLRLPGDWTRRRLRVVERLPLGAVVVARHGRPPETILDRALAGAQKALDEPFRPSWPLVRAGGLVVLGNGAVLRVALGPACHLLERQRRALRMLEEAKPGPAIAARVPWPVADGEAGFGRWALERRLPGSPLSPVLDERLLGECVEFLVALHAAGKATPERAALLDHADVVAAHADEEHARAIRSLAQSCDAVLADVPRGFAHGDFWTENLLTDSGRLVAVVDWAAAGPGRLPLLDLVHLRVSARRWSKREHIGTAVLAEMDTWARSGGDRWTQAYCRELDLVADRARLEAFLVAYWLERVALEVTTYSDRATPAWLDANVRRVARTLVEADLSLRP